MSVLEAHSISKRFMVRRPGRPWRTDAVDALRSVSVAIEDRETFGIVGESGSGKTTLARIMIGAERPGQGTVRLFGEEFRSSRRDDRRRMTEAVQMVVQDSTGTFNPRLSLGRAIAFGPWSRGMSPAESLAQAAKALDLVGLPSTEFVRRLPHEMSGGQRQRANLARALALEPRILILDEPVSSLDKSVQAQIINLLVELRAELGLTMVLISHDLAVVRYLCQRTVVMRDGAIVEQGSTDRIFDSPGDDYTRSLIAAIPGRLGAASEASTGPAIIRADMPAVADRVPGQAAPVLEVRDLNVAFGAGNRVVHALRGVSWSLAPAEVLAVVGESGSGKSVMLKTLLGLLPSHARISGEIKLGGTDVRLSRPSDLRSMRGRLAGMVFQDPLGSLDPMAPIGRQIEDVIICHRQVARREARRIGLDLLDRVHLAKAGERYGAMPHELSGGQRQRIGIALAMAGDPAVLLADEPTTALDVSVQAGILRLLDQIRAQSGVALVLVTHDMAVARELSHRVVVMYAGRFVEHGPAGAVLCAPHHPYTRGLLRSDADLISRRFPLASLHGSAHHGGAETRGCAFAARCADASDICRLKPPPSIRVAGGGYECTLPADQTRAMEPRGAFQ